MNKLSITLIVISVNLFLYYLSDTLLVTKDLYYERFIDRLTYEQIDTIIEKGQTLIWLRFLVISAMYLIKFFLISACLYLGCFFFDTKNTVQFGAIFKLVLLAETIFFVPALIRTIWFLFFQEVYSLDDVQYFYPLSLLNLLSYKSIEPWLIYPLQIANVFEIIYWVVLAYQIAPLLQKNDKTVEEEGFFERASLGLGLVSASYGTGLLVWVAVVMFLMLSYS